LQIFLFAKLNIRRLFVSAWPLLSEEEKAVFKEFYGNCTAGSPEEQRIKDIYGSKAMQEKWEAREKE
jgi:hypothetical protein